MTQDEIIRMAREAGIQEAFYIPEELERFFNLAFAAGAVHEREKYKSMDGELAELYEMAVNQGKTIREYQNAVLAEREACAKLCLETGIKHPQQTGQEACAAAIRARGE